jgi:hypothetical protein
VAALVWDGEVGDSSLVVYKATGNGWRGVDRIWSRRDSEAGDLRSEAVDEAGLGSCSGSAELLPVVLDFLDMGPGASSERACGNFSQSAKEVRGVARGLLVEVLEDGEGRGGRESVGDLDAFVFVGSVFWGLDQVRFVLVNLDGYLVLGARWDGERGDRCCR